jgi:hypothetical protein
VLRRSPKTASLGEGEHLQPDAGGHGLTDDAWSFKEHLWWFAPGSESAQAANQLVVSALYPT